MPPFLVCIHDATPAYTRETRRMIRDLAPLVGRRLSFGVVPDWHGRWPLAEHPRYCALVREAAEELLLHGYFHRRRGGWGPVTLLAEGCDEMNGLDPAATRQTLERGQDDFARAFGVPARGFLAPGWQPANVRRVDGPALGLAFVLGFLSLEPWAGPAVPLATRTWDCGRWGWLGHLGDGIGSLLHRLGDRVPTLAVHPRDLDRGFWPSILRLTGHLLDSGYEPITPTGLLERSDAEVAV